MWSYAYEFTPRYTNKKLVVEFDKNIYWNKFKFPNPKHSLYLFYNLFFVKHRPQLLRLFSYLILIIIITSTETINNLFLIFFSCGLFIYLDNRWE